MKKYIKIFPWIPIIGIPLTLIFHGKYGDTGIGEFPIRQITAFIQGISVAMLIINFLMK
jgi:hypothetical protein